MPGGTGYARLASGQGVRLNRHRGIHQFRISQAKKLADQVAARGRRLKAIIVTHPDSDHYIGTAVLRERFPDTPIYLTAAALDRMYNAACASKSVPRVRIPGRTHSTPDASGPSCWALGQLARGPRPPYRWRATRPGCRRRLRAPPAFAAYLAPLHKREWVVYAKPPFGGPPQVLEYLGRYTHRVAISNRRILALEQGQVSFAWKDYRDPQQPQKVMTVSAAEFIRRFLQHSLPPGFQRIRYYGFLANCHRSEKLALCRQLLASPCSQLLPQPAACRTYNTALVAANPRLCPRCGVGILISIQTLWPCHGPVPLRLDSS